MIPRRSSYGDCKAQVTLSMSTTSTGEPVHYKHDGARFAQPQTLKLQEGETYTLDVTVSGDSAPKLLGADIGGQRVLLSAQPCRRGSRGAGVWTADCIRATKQGERDELLLSIQILTPDNVKRSAIFPLQIKAYATPPKQARRSHALSPGEPLGTLQFEMAWEGSMPYSPIARADRFKFSRRSSSRSVESLPGVPDAPPVSLSTSLQNVASAA
eukprot:CAMPEP_0185159566 /NCGR_PEP_ID=MMETSP1139-20130426/3113_1 /TAXON_ID=298111 /ORGANISM="Pavlova sp., Strain CCMP459" /LENGTH=212 /DNA_ID=CAMNT_0027724741 /DNA_START=137 /DNA_END=775 /DNA_ORIENTATION=-